VLLDRELSVAERELTPTHKVRRTTVLEKYSAELDALYG
jgi:long-subunit acyl-CoA synthetase (AMP-forming)